MAEEIKDENKAAIIVCNKWDLVDKTPSIFDNVTLTDTIFLGCWICSREVVLAGLCRCSNYLRKIRAKGPEYL